MAWWQRCGQCAVMAALAAGGWAQDAAVAVLPVQKVQLYKCGIGAFERRGTVEGDVSLRFSFETAQMKDVLKSLYAVDLGGGRVAAVAYDSHEPVAKQLEDIPYRAPAEPALKGLLAQLQGVRVAVEVGLRDLQGRVLGTEPVQERVGEAVVTSHRLVLLRDDGGIETVALLDAAALEVLDVEVRRDLARMMKVLGKARHADAKTLQLRAEGEGARELRVGYILETPLWKTSYRLLLDGEEPPVLQGWAIVENRTDEDWVDVEMSFVAGSPLSFAMDLYTSYYPERPVLDPGRAAEGDPVLQDTEIETFEDFSTSIGLGGGAGGKFGARRAARRAERAYDAGAWRSSFAAAAEGAAVGELFAYHATAPVSIARHRAALVPILQAEAGESPRVLLYREALSAAHPTHAVHLRNGTALTLEHGPVTVFEAGTCLGETLVPRILAPGARAFLPYAIETGVSVERRADAVARPVARGCWCAAS